MASLLSGGGVPIVVNRVRGDMIVVVVPKLFLALYHHKSLLVDVSLKPLIEIAAAPSPTLARDGPFMGTKAGLCLG